MGCNRKVKLLVNLLGLEEGSKIFSAVLAGASFTKSSMEAKRIYLSKNESFQILAG